MDFWFSTVLDFIMQKKRIVMVQNLYYNDLNGVHVKLSNGRTYLTLVADVVVCGTSSTTNSGLAKAFLLMYFPEIGKLMMRLQHCVTSVRCSRISGYPLEV